MDQINMVISHIHRFEKLRDGGSLVASFQSDDSCEYWVMFPVANFEPDSPLFNDPVLVNRTTGIEVNLSRSSARLWLKKLEPFFNLRKELPNISKKSEYEVLSRMLDLCAEEAN